MLGAYISMWIIGRKRWKLSILYGILALLISSVIFFVLDDALLQAALIITLTFILADFLLKFKHQKALTVVVVGIILDLVIGLAFITVVVGVLTSLGIPYDINLL